MSEANNIIPFSGKVADPMHVGFTVPRGSVRRRTQRSVARESLPDEMIVNEVIRASRLPIVSSLASQPANNDRLEKYGVYYQKLILHAHPQDEVRVGMDLDDYERQQIDAMMARDPKLKALQDTLLQAYVLDADYIHDYTMMKLHRENQPLRDIYKGALLTLEMFYEQAGFNDHEIRDTLRGLHHKLDRTLARYVSDRDYDR